MPPIPIKWTCCDDANIVCSGKLIASSIVPEIPILSAAKVPLFVGASKHGKCPSNKRGEWSILREAHSAQSKSLS
jgi:hypothetical protein